MNDVATVAVHEAGHAVVAWALGLRPIELYILTNHDGTYQGRCNLQNMTIGTDDDAIFTIAGAAAAAKFNRFYGDVESLASATDLSAFGSACVAIALRVFKTHSPSARHVSSIRGQAKAEAMSIVSAHWSRVAALSRELVGPLRLDAAQIATILK